MTAFGILLIVSGIIVILTSFGMRFNKISYDDIENNEEKSLEEDDDKDFFALIQGVKRFIRLIGAGLISAGIFILFIRFIK